MPDTNSNPLTEQHLQDLITGLDHVETGLKQVELAKRAGIDVSQQEQDLKRLGQQLRQIKTVYFPGR